MRFIPDKKRKGLCIRHGCRRSHQVKSPLCVRHDKQKQKEKNPVNYTYNLLKSNAKRRGKDFDLTLAEFADFCQETGYLSTKGRRADASTIDRIDNSRGYSRDNIRLLTNSLNSAKGTGEERPF